MSLSNEPGHLAGDETYTCFSEEEDWSLSDLVSNGWAGAPYRADGRAVVRRVVWIASDQFRPSDRRHTSCKTTHYTKN